MTTTDPAWLANYDQLSQTAVDGILQIAATLDDLDEGEAAHVLAEFLMRQQLSDQALPASAAVLAIRFHRRRA